MSKWEMLICGKNFQFGHVVFNDLYKEAWLFE